MASFTRPTVAQLKTTIQGFFDTRLGQGTSLLRRSTINVYSAILAQAFNDNYAWLQGLTRQCTPAGATGLFLNAWATVYGLRRKAASYAQGGVECTGNSGTTLPQGSELQNSEGQRFRTLADVTLVDGQGTVAVRAVDPGVAGNTPPASTLHLVDPQPGIDQLSAGADGLTGGTDAETDSQLRARLLYRIQNPPRGGAAHDYVIWATGRPGVSHAWPVNEYLGPGSVGVAIINDQASNFYPGAPVIADVQNYLGVYPNQPGVAPMGAEVLVFAPTPEPFDFVVKLHPRTPAVEAAVEAELNDAFLRQRSPGATIPISHFNEAISLAEGERDHLIVGPGTVQAAADRIPVLGNLTFEDL